MMLTAAIVAPIVLIAEAPGVVVAAVAAVAA